MFEKILNTLSNGRMEKKRTKSIIKSPLRYPGGKGAFFPYFFELINGNRLSGGRYYEPFAGGAGVALGLLSSDAVSKAVLNDVDYHVYCFWQSVLNETDRFVESIHTALLSIYEWKKQRQVYLFPKKYSMFDVGFSTFYLNRCNRSGILPKAGPIGGMHQAGKWRLNARFNREMLSERILAIGKLRNRLAVYNFDAIKFLKTHLLPQHKSSRDLVYLDPPYVIAGNKLYLNFYQKIDHAALAEYLLQAHHFHWIVTYDDAALIRQLYSPCQRCLFQLCYSLQSKGQGKELLIAPKELKLPGKEKIVTKKWKMIRRLKSTKNRS